MSVIYREGRYRGLGGAIVVLFFALLNPALCLSAQSQSMFEAVSVRSNKTGEPGADRDRIDWSPTRLTMHDISLSGCISWAYRLSRYQLSGPEWLSMERFDISATTEMPVTEERAREMLQTLLKDRFGLAAHVEQRSLAGFELTVAKSGIKMKEAADSGPGTVRGGGVLAGSHASIAQLADFLAIPLRGPVVDGTGLQGRYDFHVDMLPYLKRDRVDKDSDFVQEVVSIFSIALDERLGLRVQRKKVPVDVTVVDRISKVPSEN